MKSKITLNIGCATGLGVENLVFDWPNYVLVIQTAVFYCMLFHIETEETNYFKFSIDPWSPKNASMFYGFVVNGKIQYL